MYRIRLTRMTANEENTFNINDLWVSAAVAQETAVFDDEDDYDEEDGDEAGEGHDEDDAEVFTPGSESAASGSVVRRRRVSRPRITSGLFGAIPHRFSMSRKYSTASGQVPAIFSNTGLSEPPAIALDVTSPTASSPQDPFFPSPAPDRRAGLSGPGGLDAIAEGRPANERSPLVSPVAGVVEPKVESSTWKALPLLLILEVSRCLVSLRWISADESTVRTLGFPQHDTRSGLPLIPRHVSHPVCSHIQMPSSTDGGL